MNGKMRLAVALGAVVALLAGPAWADFNVLDKTTWLQNGTNGAKVDEFGNATIVDADRDRDFPVLINLFTAQALGINATYQMNSPRYIGQYSKAALMLTWSGAAQADTDSTAIIVRVYGKTSLNSANRYLWTPLTSARSSADTCFCNKTVADSAGAASYCIVPPPTFIVARAAQPGYLIGGGKLSMGFLGGTVTTRGTFRKAPAYAWRQAGSNGAYIPLTDDAGNPCPFPFIEVEVGNLSGSRTLTSVSCDVWPRVN